MIVIRLDDDEPRSAALAAPEFPEVVRRMVGAASSTAALAA